MKNIELKIKLKSFKAVEKSLKILGAEKLGGLDQEDVYFNCVKGRLKTRKINNEIFELIYYERSDKPINKLSKYLIVPFDKKKFEQLEIVLTSSMGIKAKVYKSRMLWRFKNTRIHLDDVKGLGKFLELETVLQEISKTEGEKEYLKVFNLLKLNRFEKVKGSYCDML